MSSGHIDPSSINHDNLPQVMACVVTKQDTMDEKLDRIERCLVDLEDTLAPFKFSRCTVWPMLKNNKFIAFIITSAFTAYVWFIGWISSLLGD